MFRSDLKNNNAKVETIAASFSLTPHGFLKTAKH